MSYITVQIKDQYGRPVIYPVDKSAKTFARIARTTSLTDDTIKLIKSLGFTIKVQNGTVIL